MADHIDLSLASVADIGARLREGPLAPLVLVEHCLQRIEAFNPKLNAFITVTADLAREQASVAERELRAGHWRGPLHGIPVAVKDFYDTAGIRTTAGFEHFEHRVPPEDGTIASMEIEAREIRVPFEAASFDVSDLERDRAGINASLFGDVDAIVLPTLTASTPTVDDARARGDMAVSPDNTFFCNYFGLPAITIPAGVDNNGLPLGLQFVGPQGRDDEVLALASAYQRASGWRYAAPPT